MAANTSLQFVILVAAGVCAKANSVTADFDDCQNDAIERGDDDMYLIQKQAVVGVMTEPGETGKQTELVSMEKMEHHLLAKEEHRQSKTAGASTAKKAAEKLASSAPKQEIPVAAKKSDLPPNDDDLEDTGRGINPRNMPKEDVPPSQELTGDMKSNTTSTNSTIPPWVWPWSGWEWNTRKSVFTNVYHSWDVYVVSTIVTWFVWVILAILVWKCCYPAEPEMFPDPEDPIKTFKERHFDCVRRPYLCVCSCFCPAVQWAYNQHLSGLLEAYVGISVFCILALVNGLLGGFYSIGFFTSSLILLYRQKLRAKLGLKSWNLETCFYDCTFSFCCPCLAIAQEAQVVHYAYQLNASRRTPTSIYQSTRFMEASPRIISSGSAYPFATQPRRIPPSSVRTLSNGSVRVVSSSQRQDPLPTSGRPVGGAAPGNMVIARSMSPSRAPSNMYLQ
jgi:Cys-rich protein (TIGR01571 family)